MAEKKGLSDKLKSAVSRGKSKMNDQGSATSAGHGSQTDNKVNKAKGKLQETVGKFKDGTNKK